MGEVPLPIPPIVLSDNPDEIGFTTPEKKSLINFWPLVNREVEKYAYDHYMRFFMDHENQLEHFRGKDGKFKLTRLYKHSDEMFRVLEAIIFEGFDGVGQLYTVIAPLAICHQKCGINRASIKIMTDDLGEYLKGIFYTVMTPTLEMAIDKTMGAIVDAHKDD